MSNFVETIKAVANRMKGVKSYRIIEYETDETRKKKFEWKNPLTHIVLTQILSGEEGFLYSTKRTL